MPVEEIAEGVLRVLWRLLVELLVEVFLEVGCGRLGLLTLRAASLGSYPPRSPTALQRGLCIVVGLAEILGAVVLCLTYAT